MRRRNFLKNASLTGVGLAVGNSLKGCQDISPDGKKVVVTDKKTGKSINKIISVNKPLTYKGVTIYQAAFEDGGSQLDLKV